MKLIPRHGGWVIFVSLIVAFWLQMAPLPTSIEFVRPHWTLLVLLYWALALPQRPMLFIAWLTGLFHGVMQSSILGLHALSYVLIIYLIVRLYQQLRFLSSLNQAAVVFGCVLFHQFVMLWAYQLDNYPVGSIGYWLPCLTSALMWPLITLFLRSMQGRFNVV